mmetsp:Transcript_31045/g.52152  ORF Transcript_31045/g.52152 Transcript_31045/m.52152 type:complete len:207 (-) Transcript_31045:737-1357(-)
MAKESMVTNTFVCTNILSPMLNASECLLMKMLTMECALRPTHTFLTTQFLPFLMLFKIRWWKAACGLLNFRAMLFVTSASRYSPVISSNAFAHSATKVMALSCSPSLRSASFGFLSLLSLRYFSASLVIDRTSALPGFSHAAGLYTACKSCVFARLVASKVAQILCGSISLSVFSVSRHRSDNSRGITSSSSWVFSSSSLRSPLHR